MASAKHKTGAAAAQRVNNEPAYVLHHYDWSESSLILEMFTRTQGRQVLVAKGVKRPTSSFRPVLLPLQPLYVSYRMATQEASQVHTLKAAQWVGGHTMPTGDALLSGYYLNELLLRLLAREDPEPVLFDAYAAAVRVLATQPTHTLEPVLRAFELILLRVVGLLPAFNVETVSLVPVQEHRHYVLEPELGLCRVADGGDEAAGASAAGLTGLVWKRLHQAVHQQQSLSAVLQALVHQGAAELKSQIRALLHYHGGQRTLRTRQLMMDLHSL